MNDTTRRSRVFSDLDGERDRQEAKFPEQHLPDGTGPHVYWGIDDPESAHQLALDYRDTTEAHVLTGTLTWLDVLREEVAEAFAEADQAKLRAELIQVAAVAIRWIEDIDRRSETAT